MARSNVGWVFAIFVAGAGCVGEAKHQAQAPAPAPAPTSRQADPASVATALPAVGGGPRDLECSAYLSPPDRSWLPTAPSGVAWLDSCPPKALPPIDSSPKANTK